MPTQAETIVPKGQRKSEAQRSADVRKALADMKTERDATREQLAALLAERDEALATIKKLRTESVSLGKRVESLSRDRDELVAEEMECVAVVAGLIQEKKTQTEPFIRHSEELRKEKEEEAQKFREQIEAISQELQSIRDAYVKLESEKLSLISQADEICAGHEAETQALQEARAIVTRERDEVAGQVRELQAASARELDRLRSERDCALSEREKAAAAAGRIITAQKDEIAALAGERDTLLRAKEQLANKLAGKERATADRLDERSDYWERIIGEKDSLLEEGKQLIDRQKHQIESLQQRDKEHSKLFETHKDQLASLGERLVSAIKDRDEALAQIARLEQAFANQTHAAEAERLAAHQQREQITQEFAKLAEDQKRQIEKLSGMRGAQMIERDHQIAELNAASQRQQEISAARERDLTAERDQALSQLAVLKSNAREAIAAVKAEQLEVVRQREAALARLNERNTAQEQQIEAMTQEHAKAVADKGGQLSDAMKKADAQQSEIDGLTRQRDQLAGELLSAAELRAAATRDHEAAMKQLGEATEAQKAQIDSLVRQRDQLIKERNAARTELGGALAAHAAHLTSLGEQRDALVAERELAVARFGEINQEQERQLNSLHEQSAAAVKEKEAAVAQLTVILEAQMEQLNSLRGERDSALREKQAALGELTRLNAAQKQQIAGLEAERLRLIKDRAESGAQWQEVAAADAERIRSLDEQLQLAIQEKTEGLSQFEQVNQVLAGRMEEITRERDNFERQLQNANARLLCIHEENRAATEPLLRARDELHANLGAIRTECDALRRERDEVLALEARSKENHRLQLETLALDREELIGQRDRALVRLEAFERNGEEDVLRKARAAYEAEIDAMAAAQKNLSAQLEEALARLERFKESEKLQTEKLIRESVDLVEERDRAVVHLEQTCAEFERKRKEFETTREYLVKERDKALALLDQARDAQKQIEQSFEQMTPVFQELQKPGHGEGNGQIQSFIGELQQKWQLARNKASEAGSLKPLELSSAEKLLTRHKYELDGTIAGNDLFVQARARDVNMDRVVELKMVAPGTNGHGDLLAQLIGEAKKIGRLEHPNIQPMYELSIDETGRAFYAAKLLNGTTLAKILDDLHAKKAGAVVNFDLRRLLAIFDHVCDALAFAHDNSVAHGHLTAEAIHVGTFGDVIVTGWEGARSIDCEHIGTYEEDVRPDVLGLGNLLYHLLTLTRALPGEPTLRRPDESWLVPKGLWKLTRRLVATRRAASFPNIKQIQMEVEHFRYELGPRAGRATAFEKLKGCLQKWQ